MFFLSIMDTVFWIHIIAAVAPAIFLLKYVYDQDKIEREPLPLILKLIFMGVIAGLAAIVLETIGEKVLGIFVPGNNQKYTILLAFLVVACAEEGMKFLLLRKTTWDNPEFNFRYDGIVYAASVSLGFAAFENIGYIFRYGLSIAGTRALFAIPGHLGFSVFMGYFYGRAKLCDDIGDDTRKQRNLTAAFLVPVFLHGFYDSCAMLNTVLSNVLFYTFVIIMYIIVFRMVKREAANDRAV